MTLNYFTVLILTYYVQGEYIQTKFLLESMKDCDRLIRVIVEPVRIARPQPEENN